jgi:D-Tyr-tRNAtyr deacylase
LASSVHPTTNGQRFLFDSGKKPDFHKAMKSDQSREMYAKFVQRVGQLHKPELVKDGVFGAMMDVSQQINHKFCS